jgi:ribosomal-protein-alanine N-acetyltransferase
MNIPPLPFHPITPPVPLAPGDHRDVEQLFRRAGRRHLHLDWRTLEAWLPNPALCCWVIHGRNTVQAVMGATIHTPPEGPAVAWLRFIVPASQTDDDPSLEALWEALAADLRGRGVGLVGVLLLDGWIDHLLTGWGFAEDNAVISMARRRGWLPDPPTPPLTIREMQGPAELDEIVRLDHAAFGPLWQYSRDTLAAAQRQSATFTRLEREGELIGYQLSTEHIGSAHLARLAVLPAELGHGYGGLLTGEMARFFAKRGIELITVNTQEDNIRSQRLYARLGFRIIGQRAPVWTLAL